MTHDDKSGTDDKGIGSTDLLEGAYLAIEYDYLCIRNGAGRLLWSARIKGGNEHSLKGIIEQCEKNQRDWLVANGATHVIFMLLS